MHVNGPRALIRRLDSATLSSKLIEVIQYDAAPSQFAIVVAVGNGRQLPDGRRIPMDITPGQVVVTKPYCGMAVQYKDEECHMVVEDDILAVCEGL